MIEDLRQLYAWGLSGRVLHIVAADPPGSRAWWELRPKRDGYSYSQTFNYRHHLQQPKEDDGLFQLHMEFSGYHSRWFVDVYMYEEQPLPLVLHAAEFFLLQRQEIMLLDDLLDEVAHYLLKAAGLPWEGKR